MIHIINDEATLYQVCYDVAARVDIQALYFDFETTGLDPYTCYILLLAFKFDQDEYVLDCTKVRNWAEIVKPFFENSAYIKVAHNMVFDYKFMYHQGIEAKPAYCTFVTEQLLTAGLHGVSNSLQAVALRRLSEVMDKSVREGFIGRAIDDVKFDESELRYAAKDVQVLPVIRAQQIEEIAHENMQQVHDLEMRLLPVTAMMEYAGIDFDVEKANKAIPAFEAVADKAFKTIQDTCINAGISDRIVFSKDGYEAVRWSSPQQKLAVLNRLGIDVESTANEELADWDARWTARQKRKLGQAGNQRVPKPDDAQFFVTDDSDSSLDIAFNHPLLRQHAIFQAADKALTTYLRPLPTRVNPVTKRIHPNFKQCGASATGRYSSSEPNFQNIIKKWKLDLIGLGEHDIRAMFIAGEGNKFVTADFSGIELVILAALSGDENLLYQIQNGDVHSYVGSNLFEVQFDKKMAKSNPYDIFRDVAKTTTFGIVYGIGGRAIYRKMSIPLASVGYHMKPEMGDQWIERWYGLFPKTAALLKQNAEKAVTKLYTESVLGRRRHWTYDMLRERGKIFAAMREGKNAPIQSSSADLTKLSELILSENIDWKEAQLVACIHDELIIRTKEEYADKYIPILQHAMREAGRQLFPNLPPGVIDPEPSKQDYYTK